MRVNGIRTTLAVLVVGCILPLASAVAFLILNFYANQQAQLSHTVISRARAMVSVLDRDFGVTQAALLALGSSPLLETDDLHGFHQQAVAALPSLLSKALADQRFPDSWRVVITDSTGRIVARTHGIETYLGKKASPDLLAQMALADEGSSEGRTLEGMPVLRAHSRSQETGWAVAVGIPMGEVTAPLKSTLAWLIAATIAALAIGLALSWFIGGRIARSVVALAAPAKALGLGDMAPLPHLHFKEANVLAQAMQAAAATLQQAQFKAHHDGLTGLANRALFHLSVDRQLKDCLRNHAALAILFIDLDGFKKVNDTHGHAAGDMLLCAVAERLKLAIRDSDIAARLGGDEFALALIHTDMQNAMPFAGRLIDALSAPYPLGPLGEVQARVSASIGIAACPASATDINTLLHAADRAMYQAKALGAPLLKRMLADGQAGLSDLFLGPITGRLVYTIAVPVKREGELVYTLNATVQPERALRVLAEQKFPDSWRVAITDSSGSIVARSHATPAFFGKKVAPELLQSISQADEGSLEAMTLDGIPVLTAFSRSPTTKWVAAIGTPLAEVTAGLQLALALLVLATLAALAAGLVVAKTIGRRIARSISALTAPATALGMGEELTVPPLHFAEANALRQALLDAGDRLRHARYEAHHDVLTGLANRAMFHIFVERQLSLCRRNKTGMAIL